MFVDQFSHILPQKRTILQQTKNKKELGATFKLNISILFKGKRKQCNFFSSKKVRHLFTLGWAI